MGIPRRVDSPIPNNQKGGSSLYRAHLPWWGRLRRWIYAFKSSS